MRFRQIQTDKFPNLFLLLDLQTFRGQLRHLGFLAVGNVA